MKRALLIAGGTVGGLGAVLAITPPQLSNNSTAIGGGLDIAPSTSTTSASPSASATASATPSTSKSTKPTTAATKSAKPTATATHSSTATQSPVATASASPTASATPTKATSNKATSGTFVGDPYTMRYGTVQVQITINNGKITDAQAVQAPGGGNQRFTDRAVPIMRQNTLAAQSSNITGASGASYTSYAWYISLQSALKKAGWM
jgi:uncharacterized protein with FMN-binding domain